jgi:hypothetical protein
MAPELGHAPRDAVVLIRRYPGAALLPAVALGLASDVLQLWDSGIASEVVVGLVLGVAFELYVAYAERLVLEAELGPERIGAAGRLRAAMPLLPPLLLASVPAVVLPAAASGLLLVPGLWLLTRWVLYAPVIAREGAGPLAALRRSSALVRGRFWSVFAVAGVAVIVEHAVIHVTAHEAEPALGSELLGLLGAAVAVTAVTPLAALTISLVYSRLSGSPEGWA